MPQTSSSLTRARKVRDWVVLYFHSDSGGEAQRTIVTETRGALTGERVVRGRERECFSVYERAASRSDKIDSASP